MGCGWVLIAPQMSERRAATYSRADYHILPNAQSYTCSSMTDNEIEQYFKNRIQELKQIATRGDPWIFLNASSFIEYLAKMRLGRTTTRRDYKDFLKQYFFQVCPRYGNFKYRSAKLDLADQMYHVLRCGVVHSFSLFADPQARVHGGQDRSIVLAHRLEGKAHLSPFVNNRRKPKIDAAIFVAEDFVEDIERVTETLFKESKKRTPDGRELRQNIRRWVKQFPPIGATIL
ncbi:MAG TPA: hypothetical protein VF532_15860 [Candidatus Angelobacter sp.]